jgi:glutamate-1-semialdehyde 2,1-aminomutase
VVETRLTPRRVIRTPVKAPTLTGRSFARSRELWDLAEQVIAGGVTSAVRAGALPHPLYFERGAGAELWDVDGNRYLDFALGYGPLILGHAPKLLRSELQDQLGLGTTFGSQHRGEVTLATLLSEIVPGAERVLLSNTGSEAVAAAIRVARAATGRSVVVKFEGHYDGWLDPVLVSTAYDAARSGPADSPAVVPATGGIAPGSLRDVAVAPWNDADAVERLLEGRGGEVAAVICEPILVNGGVIAALPGFLERVAIATRRAGALLIFDEVITGFRVALGGAQERLGIRADLAVFAKALAGGLPLSAVTGSAAVLEVVADRRVAHNGTFNGNPLAVRAATATLTFLRDGGPALYAELERVGDRLAAGLASVSPRLTVRHAGPIVHTAVDEPPDVRNVRDRASGRPDLHARWVEALLRRGIHATPRGLWYVSTAHRDEHIDEAVAAAADAAREVLGRPTGA